MGRAAARPSLGRADARLGPWEVAQEADLEKYFQLYARAGEDERIVLLEMILEAASNELPAAALHATWPRIRVLLDQQAVLHATTAEYWCV